MAHSHDPGLPEAGEDRDGLRARVVEAASGLLATGGRDAATTRAVAMAAGVQAPTLYRLFGDKRGLLDAVVQAGYLAYMGQKAALEPGPDAVADLRRGWDLHVGFGLANPAIYALMVGEPRPPVVEAAYGHLRTLMRRIAEAGRLKVGEVRAAAMVHAGASGTVLALLALPPDRRDGGLSEATREAVLTAILTDAAPTDGFGPASAAVTLRAALPQAAALSEGERVLLAEWLDRLA